MPSSGVERLPFAACPTPFTGPSFEIDDVDAAQRAIRKTLRSFRRARCVDPCLGVRLRPRQAARRRRDQRRRARRVASSPSRGDPDLDAAALLADLDQAGGRELFELSRAYWLNGRGWDYSRWHAALNTLIEQERTFTYDEGGDDVWIIVRRAA